MKEVTYYSGREQTYLKHFLLEKYLERFAYIIGYYQPEVVYVDGFSGPWKSKDEAFEDTSFVIAIKILRKVRTGLAKRHKHPSIRCLFIEKDADAFAALREAVGRCHDLDITPLNGDFEELIPSILGHIGPAFSLVFIDPTGWTGFGLQQIERILKHRPGEVLINFMFDHINRFLHHPDAQVAASFDKLFGGRGWNSAVHTDDRKENAILELYCDRLRNLGEFKHVARTRILKPTSDRSYFYLVYGTRHLKGLQEFRGIEKKFVEEQERVRTTAKQTRRVARTGQPELFAAATHAASPSYQQERRAQLSAASEDLLRLLRKHRQIRYEDALGALLERPYVWESDVRAAIQELNRSGKLDIVGLKRRERTPKEGHFLVGLFQPDPHR